MHPGNGTKVSKPPFESLPLQKDGPQGNAWGLFGADDQLGMLNLLDPSTTTAATKEIQYGTRIPTDLSLDYFKFPFNNRLCFNQEIRSKTPRPSNDDILTLNTQTSSQWDGFRHYGYQDRKLYYNGRSQDHIHQTVENGIHVWVDNGGIVGRGVLLDYHSWATNQGISHPATASTTISLSELLQVASAQHVSFRRGDILFVRSGFLECYGSLSFEAAADLATMYPCPSIGLEASEQMLRWIWETEFSAVASDSPSFESWPCQDKRYWLHEWLLAGWGMPIGELFDLEKLAAECRKNQKWTFFFSSMPLNVPGGVASPPNGVAIL